MLKSLDISASAMSALRIKLDVVTENLTKANALTDSSGKYNPYRRKEVFFAPGDPRTGSPSGVHMSDKEN